jgi:hypothetical protein
MCFFEIEPAATARAAVRGFNASKWASTTLLMDMAHVRAPTIAATIQMSLIQSKLPVRKANTAERSAKGIAKTVWLNLMASRNECRFGKWRVLSACVSSGAAANGVHL